MFMKRPQYRRFDYTPRFYKPELDEEERRKRKLGFRSARMSTRKRAINPLIWLIFILMIIFILVRFGNL